VSLLLTRTPSPAVWPLLLAVAGAAVLAFGVQPRSTTTLVLAALLLVTAGINDVAARVALNRERQEHGAAAADRVARQLRARLARPSGIPTLTALVKVTLVGTAMLLLEVGGNLAAALAGIGAATTGAWSLRLVERSSAHALTL
jgi:hypothetical protein